MNKSAKILLVYSIVVSGLIITSGFIFNPNVQNWLLQLIFAPVPIFLLYTLVSKTTDLKITNRQLIFAIIMMAALLFIGVTNVQKSMAKDEVVEDVQEKSSTIFSITNGEKVEDKNESNDEQLSEITVVNNTFVNIRKEPRAVSPIVGIVENGDTYETIGYEDGWYLILLDDETSGYIFEQFTEISNESNEQITK